MSTALFPTLQPRTGTLPEGIDLRCCDVAEVLAVARGARLVVADPPWLYEREAGVANPENQGIYHGLPEAEIVAHIDASYDCADPEGSRLLVWYTWTKEEEWREAGQAGKRWGRRVTAGAFTKWPRMNGGVGHHWRGMTEPVAMFTRGKAPLDRDNTCYNGAIVPQSEHSYKPVEWQRAWIRAWTSPGDLVLDLYAGLGSVAVACALEGRRYIGAEIDPERHRRAVLRVQEALEAQ